MLAQMNHVAQLYVSDAELVDSIAGFVQDAVARGGTGIVIATPEHVDQVARRLGPGPAAGVDFLDAAETLNKLELSGSIDPRAFNTAIGTLVRVAARRSGPVHAYGEMVALLWRAGRVSDAMELERLWNELARTVSFSLLCGYPATAMSSDDNAIRHLCSLHSAIVGLHAPRAHLRAAAQRFTPTIGSIRAARAFVVDQLREWGHDTVLEDANLVTSELVTNSFLHARSAFDVSVSSSAGVVRVAVSDASRATAVRTTTSSTPTSGRGLLIVAALATRWDTTVSPDGKTVWAEFGC